MSEAPRGQQKSEFSSPVKASRHSQDGVSYWRRSSARLRHGMWRFQESQGMHRYLSVRIGPFPFVSVKGRLFCSSCCISNFPFRPCGQSGGPLVGLRLKVHEKMDETKACGVQSTGVVGAKQMTRVLAARTSRCSKRTHFTAQPERRSLGTEVPPCLTRTTLLPPSRSCCTPLARRPAWRVVPCTALSLRQ